MFEEGSKISSFNFLQNIYANCTERYNWKYTARKMYLGKMYSRISGISNRFGRWQDGISLQMTTRQLQTIQRRWLLFAVKNGVSAATKMKDEHYIITLRSYWRLKETEWSIYTIRFWGGEAKEDTCIILKMHVLRIMYVSLQQRCEK